MNKLALLTLGGALGVVISATAQDWQLVDNFDDGTVNDWVITASSYNNIGLLPEYEEGDIAYMMTMYPTGYEEGTENANPAMHIESGGYGFEGQYGDTFCVTPVPVVAGDQTDCTIYFQYFQEGGDNTLLVGASALELVPWSAPEDDPSTPDVDESAVERPGYLLYTQPNTWSHHAFMMAFNVDNTIQIRDGNRYAVIKNLKMESYKWYEFWFVVHNREGSYQSPDGDTYEVWIKGGEFAEATKILIPPAQELDANGDPNPMKEEAVFRVATVDPLRYISVISQTGAPGSPNGGDPALTDDFYMTLGVHVETPPGATVRTNPESWNGYPVTQDELGNKYADTGPFMGTIYLLPESNWVYSYALENWIYADVNYLVPEAGGWVYVSM